MNKKKILIEYIDDWYLYSFAIIDPESLIWILELVKEKLKISASRKAILKDILNESLKIHARYLSSYKGPLFFYSISEYNSEKENFSLMSDNKKLDKEKNEILKAAKALCF